MRCVHVCWVNGDEIVSCVVFCCSFSSCFFVRFILRSRSDFLLLHYSRFTVVAIDVVLFFFSLSFGFFPFCFFIIILHHHFLLLLTTLAPFRVVLVLLHNGFECHAIAMSRSVGHWLNVRVFSSVPRIFLFVLISVFILCFIANEFLSLTFVYDKFVSYQLMTIVCHPFLRECFKWRWITICFKRTNTDFIDFLKVISSTKNAINRLPFRYEWDTFSLKRRFQRWEETRGSSELL